MDRLIKVRRVTRTNITKTWNKINDELNRAVPDKQLLLVYREDLHRLVETIVPQDQDIINMMIEVDNTDEEISVESDDITAYRNRITLAEIKIEEYMKPANDIDHGSNQTVTLGNGQTNKTYKLPKVELKKFNGELTEWLSFWAQFEKIHEDKTLHNSDKFQYLTQSMKEGTRAKELVNSYPQTADNYPKVVNALKERFGKIKILKQVYVRELIKMITINARIQEKTSLSKLYDKLESHLRALESLTVTVEQMTEFLFPMVESSLPEDILVAWQRSPNFGRDGSIEVPPKSELDYLMSFLRQEIESEEQRTLARVGFSTVSLPVNKTNKPQENSYNERKQLKEKSNIPTATSLFIGNTDNCIFCSKSHPSQDCIKAMQMTLKTKQDVIKQKRACNQCLKIHGNNRCKIWVKCSGCFKTHYHLMCPDRPNLSKDAEIKGPSINNNMISNQIQSNEVLLKTILIKIKTNIGTKIARMLFDDGSQRSYIKSSVAIEMRCYEKGKYFERNTLFGGIVSNIEERTIYQVPVLSWNGKINRKLELPDKKQITGKVLKIPNGPWMQELKSEKIWINDYTSEKEDVDILIGADLIPSLVTDESITLKCGLKAIKTVFGWVIMGPLPNNSVHLSLSNAMVVTIAQLEKINLKNLWDLEVIGIQDPVEVKTKTEKEIQTKQYFIKTVSRNPDGRYKVSLPWVDGYQNIPNNFGIAEKRLKNGTKKLKENNGFKTYDSIFKQWEKEHFIEEINVSSEDLYRYHFIPHHPVFKPASKTTPVRPVFDASCKIGRNPSLNECLEKGPNLIELIPTVMIQFREGKIGVLSDIRKAFQMIDIKKEDQDYLLFLWWKDESCEKIIFYKHKRVVFGLKSSPFILGAVINLHLDNVKKEYVNTAEKFRKSLYVDNSVTSVNSISEYIEFKEQATRIFKEAKMELRQWEHTVIETFNNSLVKGIEMSGENNPSDDENFANISLPRSTLLLENENVLVLGMNWNRYTDTLSCATIPEVPEELTKRSLLALISKIFDPLGLLAAAMIYPKLMIQSTWAQKIGWNDELPKEVSTRFRKWSQELQWLSNIEIPRNMKGNDYCPGSSSEQLHIFCDASQAAYATVVFLRIENKESVTIRLIQAKARITPIKNTTIPRLELMGCVIGARLGNSIHKTLTNKIPCFYWSDSTTALSWIKRNDEWGTFVGNRVREILTLSSVDNWRHIPGKLNPADLPSRGCSPKELFQSKWWEGPDWLIKPQDQWPNEDLQVDEEVVDSEKRKITKEIIITSNKSIIVKDPWFATKSSYILCLRNLAWIKRFINNCLANKRKLKKQNGFLRISEINEAEFHMVQLVQNEVFPENSNFIEGLRVSRDNEMKLYHVITKILNRQDTGRFRKPLLLPNTHPVVKKLIEEIHIQYGHAGSQFLIGKLREKFWIVKTRKAVKEVVKNCITCRRYMATIPAVPTAPLPENRVKEAKVFEVTGIDLAGPLHLIDNSKIWVVLFTCAVYRAVHLECVDRINTEEFLLALARFTSRRGRVSIIYTDNGSNFVGTANLFGKLDWNKICSETMATRIQWIFNPPESPWWGGFFERMIRTLKEYLRKILGQNKLDKVNFETILCFVESLINGRPLTYISEDPDDLIPLTPAVFIQDIQVSDFPEIEILDDKQFRSKYKDLLQMKKELRSRFRSEYLGLLVERTKPVNSREFEVGEIVLIVSDNKKRLEWPMARILELLPGKDNISRVARVKTSEGELLRPFKKLIPLEVKNTVSPLPVMTTVKKHAMDLRQESIMHDEGINQKVKKEIKVDDMVITRSGRRVKKPVRFRL